MNENIINVSDNDFKEKVLGSDVPVLVDFWAPWCAPCRMVAPVLEQLAAERDGAVLVAKLNTDKNQQTARQYGIMSIPSLIVFHKGKAIEGTVGAIPYDLLDEWLDNLFMQFEEDSIS